MGLTFYFLSFIVFYLFLSSFTYKIVILNILKIFSLSFYMDWMSLVFLFVLFLMVGSVLFFSEDYMVGEDLKIKSFINILLVFVASMVVLIVSGDWVTLILGWDWLGISSFFLVAYYKSESGWVGSLKTYMTNRLGDGFFIFLISMLLFNFIYSMVHLSLLISGLLILLCQTKSAQLPFSAWLPAAMSAPTPVSSLVHSSTLVTAGVFMLIRSGFVKSLNNFYLSFVGMLTLFVGSFSACGSFDVKKVVAFSTLSHLGFMFLCMSSGVYLLSFFHLLTHACFKALLFISVGMLIMKNNHSQDFRQLGFSKCKVFYIWVGTLSVLSLCGFPFFSGFFSKDFMIEHFFWFNKMVSYMLLLFSLVFSSYYSFRLILKLSKMNWSVSMNQSYESLKFYLIFLLMGSITLGWILSKNFFLLSFVSSKVFLKLIIYFFLFVGLYASFYSFNPLVASTMSFLDSLGGGLFKNINVGVFSYFKSLDQGVLPYVSEKWELNKVFKDYVFKFNFKIFYYFWLSIFMFFLLW